jgi:hypothetical protein
MNKSCGELNCNFNNGNGRCTSRTLKVQPCPDQKK